MIVIAPFLSFVGDICWCNRLQQISTRGILGLLWYYTTPPVRTPLSWSPTLYHGFFYFRYTDRLCGGRPSSLIEQVGPPCFDFRIEMEKTIQF